MHCITVNQEGSQDISTVDKLKEYGTANTYYESDGIKSLVSRTINDRPANEDRIRGMEKEEVSDPNGPPFIFSRREYEELYHAPGVTDAHRVWIDNFFEAGIFVMEGENPAAVPPIEEATA